MAATSKKGQAQTRKTGTQTKKKKTSTPVKTSSAKNSAAKEQKPVSEKNREQQMKYHKIVQEAVILVILALCVIFFLANFGVGGVVGAGISYFFFGMFGIVAYIFPVLLFAGALFSISNKNNSVAKIKMIAAVFAMIFICTLIQLISGSHAEEWKYTEYFTNSASGKNGGGFLGGSFCKLFCTWFGNVGAYIFDIVLIVVCVVLISERSFLNGIKKQSKKAYDTARYDVEQHRKEAEHKRRIRERRKEVHELDRANRKVRGVAFDTEIPKEQEEVLDVHEITANQIKEDPFYRFEQAEAAMQHYEEEQSDSHLDYLKPGNVLEETVIPEPLEPEQEPEPELLHASVPDVAPASELYEEREKKPEKTDTESIGLPVEETFVEVPKKEPVKKIKAYRFPPLSLLHRGNAKSGGNNQDELRQTAMKLQQTLSTFGVRAQVVSYSCGPAVTRYELQPEQGVKVSKIVSLADDIKLSLAAADIRIEAPIPGKSLVGIEVPNKENAGVVLGDLIAGKDFRDSSSKITFAAGKDISGNTVIADIAKMPHLLIAGATGSGKSVCINTIIMSILYHAKPDEVKLIMVDPKVVELSVYNGIPHLLIPVVTDPKKAAGALNWAVAEMTDRYQKFAQVGVRDMKGYNEKIEQLEGIAEEQKPQKMPQIVIIVDELADLMMVSSKEVEDAIVRLAQLARAAGIHLVIATQRPSVNVITGLIKANVPSRIAFAVSSGVDSRTIIDMYGAEKLLGKGDMLFYPQGKQKPERVQGAFVSDEEVTAVVEYLKEHNDTETYNESISTQLSNPGFAESQAFGQDQDSYFAEAGKCIIEKQRASIGMLQRVFKIGFNRAARIMDQLGEAGVVGPEEGTKPRKVLMTMEEFIEYLNNHE